MIGIIEQWILRSTSLKRRCRSRRRKQSAGFPLCRDFCAADRQLWRAAAWGKVNAAVCAQTMILNYAPESVINTGVAGSLSNTLDIGDVVVADYVVQGDVDTTALGDPPGFISTVDIIKFRAVRP